jgi:hypothetical protein
MCIRDRGRQPGEMYPVTGKLIITLNVKEKI